MSELQQRLHHTQVHNTRFLTHNHYHSGTQYSSNTLSCSNTHSIIPSQEERRRDEGFLSGLVIGAGYDHHDQHITGLDGGDMGMGRGVMSEKMVGLTNRLFSRIL